MKDIYKNLKHKEKVIQQEHDEFTIQDKPRDDSEWPKSYNFKSQRCRANKKQKSSFRNVNRSLADIDLDPKTP